MAQRKVGMVRLSVILLTKNGEGDLKALLPALFEQQQTVPFEVIAVDSGSTDGTVELLKSYPVRVHQIPPESFHHARTRNLAARLATGELLIFLSQDAVPASALWLSKLISNFDDPRVGAVYGRQMPKPGSLLERQDTFDIIYGTHRVVKDPSQSNGLGYRFYHFSDVNSAIRRTVWQETGFPEDLKVFEDIGIAKRILDSGWKIVYEPEAAVVHSHNHSTVGLFKRYFDIGYTLKLLKIWDASGIRGSLWRDGCKLIQRKFDRTNRQQSAGKGIQQDLAKSLGMFLGLNQACLPLAVKRHFSAFGVFE